MIRGVRISNMLSQNSSGGRFSHRALRKPCRAFMPLAALLLPFSQAHYRARPKAKAAANSLYLHLLK